MKSLSLFLTTGALALFAAGCGGDDDNKTATTGDESSETRGYAETGALITDICKRVEEEGTRLAKDLTGEAENDAPLVEKLVDATQGYVDELKAIEPDPKLQSTFDQYVAAVEANQAKSEEVLEVAKTGDSEAYRMAAEAASGDRAETDKLERALGATGCPKG